MPGYQVIQDIAATAHAIHDTAYAMGHRLHHLAKVAPADLAAELQIMAAAADHIADQAGTAEAEAETLKD